jgi:thiol-disulfide isomerase/thioredoxin
MKIKLLAALTALTLVFVSAPAQAQQTELTPAQKELQTVIEKVQEKLKNSKGTKLTEADLAEEFKEFDALMAKHKSEKTDDVAQILYMKSMLYLQVLNKPDEASTLIEQLKRDFPDTKQGKSADRILEGIKKQQASAKIRDSLAPGSKFPDFDEKDLDGKSLSVANYKGKVVLIDFWATWCGPCVHELPNVIKTYEKHHGEGFEIIGISLDREGEKEKQKLLDFLKEKNMTWQQYYDGKYWENKLAVKYGVQSIPATYLLDGEGKILGKDLRGEKLEEAVTKALGKG